MGVRLRNTLVASYGSIYMVGYVIGKYSFLSGTENGLLVRLSSVFVLLSNDLHIQLMRAIGRLGCRVHVNLSVVYWCVDAGHVTKD